MDTEQYLSIFLEEAKEHLQALNNNILELENNTENLDIVQEIFRSAHTLKGMSATMNFNDMSSLTHDMENVLDLIRNNKLLVSSDILDVIFNCLDLLENMVIDIESGGEGKEDVSDVVEKLKAIANGDFKSSEAAKTDNENSKGNLLVQNEFSEYELTIIKHALENAHNVFNIEVVLNDNCVMKSARAYMVFQNLEDIGEIIKSSPSVEEIEDEKFEHSFHITIITQSSLEETHKLINQVSEIKDIIIHNISGVKELLSQNSKEIEDKTDTNTKTEEKATTNKVKSNDKKKSVGGKTIRVDIEKLDILMNLFSELVIDKGRLEQISRDSKLSDLNDTVEHMSRISNDLQSVILTMRMVQIEQVFNRFPRMIRDLAKDLDKKVNLNITGADTELDRTVIDEIGDPLVHLLRNSVDHGIETPEERKKAGKDETGNLNLSAYHSGNHVFIEVSDDGNGINKQKVIQKSIEKGIITPEKAETLSDQKAYELILSSGFSTADTISDVSGRGVGLDVVKNKIEKLGGSISIESKEGKGSKFTIELPLTLSIIHAMLVNIQNEKYAIPINSIIETAVFNKKQILKAHGQDVIDFRGRIIPIVYLKNVLQVPQTLDETDKISIVIVQKGEKLSGFVVDSFIGQQEIVLKNIGDIVDSSFISGATILGDGQVALILDINKLV